ncbi:hypothetical protein [Paractinoplanes toevensis]|uniref:Uncharacterized protein n=1 Tax=Paractinoplanes toevensis TaxID=571911 RepID=A0A919T6M0_9ACTN|nr:hypothetical protein [Actinoplanes toevensis]GIM88825.1 hypothetical protein Ato02nite_006180 [Actinoplanes toevensis]
MSTAVLEDIYALAERRLTERPTGMFGQPDQLAMIGLDFGPEKPSVIVIRDDCPTRNHPIDVAVCRGNRPAEFLTGNVNPALLDEAADLLARGEVTLPNQVPYGLVERDCITAIITFALELDPWTSAVCYAVQLAEDATFSAGLIADDDLPGALANTCRALWQRVDDGTLIPLSDRLLAAGPVVQTAGATRTVATVAHPGGFPALADRYVGYNPATGSPLLLDECRISAQPEGWTQDLCDWWKHPFQR